MSNLQPERTTTLIIHPQPLYGIPGIKFETQMICNFAITTTANEATVPICDILSFYVYQTKQLNSDDANLLFHPDILNHLCVQHTAGNITRHTAEQTITLPLDKPTFFGIYTYDNSPLICIRVRNLPKTFVFYAHTTLNAALQFIRQEYINLHISALDTGRQMTFDDGRLLPGGQTLLCEAFLPGQINYLQLSA